ncbi:hypothetical protein CMO91_04875 [Candidatus Woesearchaeota archaeon]|nr:hypothetical protein [Candidatus Woesearchaeota archaeon]
MAKQSRVTLGPIEDLVGEAEGLKEVGRATIVVVDENRIHYSTPFQESTVKTKKPMHKATRAEFLSHADTFLENGEAWLAEATFRPYGWFVANKLSGKLYVRESAAPKEAEE